MGLPRELVDAMQTVVQAENDSAPAGNLAAAAALVGDFTTESAGGSLDRLLMLCEDGADPRAAADLAAEACERADLLDAEIRRFLNTARQV